MSMLNGDVKEGQRTGGEKEGKSEQVGDVRIYVFTGSNTPRMIHTFNSVQSGENLDSVQAGET